MEQRNQLIQLFLEKNRQINLSAIRDEKGVFIKHIQDSLEITKFFDFPKGSSIADLGTGSWFPLIPLAKEFPECYFTGIDSVKKKTVAINDILKEMKIENAEVMRTRIEDITDKKFDFLTARAVAYADKLIPRAYPLLKKWWKMIFRKQESEEEFKTIEKMLKKYHLKLETTHKYSLFAWDIERIIYIIEKE